MNRGYGEEDSLGALMAARRFVGKEIARYRRRRALTTREEFAPPNLRSSPDPGDFAAPEDLTSLVPVNMYWGRERYFDLDGCSPAGIPRWLSRFDWVVGFEYGWADPNQVPQSVFCEPSYLPKLLSFLERRWPDLPESPRLLVASSGPDVLLSWHNRRTIRALGKYFSCFFYEAKDVGIPGVHIMPIGFTEHYLRPVASEIAERAQHLHRDVKPGSDQLSVLAAWGTWWPTLDEVIPDRRAARHFAAHSGLVTSLQVASAEWFEALAQFDFMLCPLGNGIQAPKMMEALLMGCIPITTRHPTFVELQERGVPILVVDRWEDITAELLKESYPNLFPGVMAFRTKLLNLDQWWSFSFPCHAHEPAHFVS